MIHETPFEAEISRRCQCGELCARVLLHGDFCGREIARKYDLELCQWHSEEARGKGAWLPEADYLRSGRGVGNVGSRCRVEVSWRVWRRILGASVASKSGQGTNTEEDSMGDDGLNDHAKRTSTARCTASLDAPSWVGDTERPVRNSGFLTFNAARS